MSSSRTHTKFAATLEPNRRRVFRSRPTFGVALALVGLLGSVPACGDDDDDYAAVATGGAGGARTGGAANGGGKGGTSLGGTVGTGGKATGGGGTATGGTTTGGTTTGGTGGTGVGGTSGGTAGSTTGGSTTGGAAGAETGGAGGVETGGAGGALGGTDSGGTGAGGEADGGSSVGGAGGEGGGSGTDPLAGTATRPLLTPTLAANDTILKHLEKAGSLLTTGPVTDNWDPTAGVGDLTGVTPTFHVAATGGTHTTVQAAITAAVTAGGTTRVYIQVDAGTYREVVCVPNSAPPITLYSTNSDASQTVIAYDNYNAKPKAVDAPANPCNPNLAGTTFGTSGSATFAAYAKGFQAKNLSFVNDLDEVATGVANGLQGVALMTQADQLVFENIRALGNQDTLYVKTPNVDTVSRAYFKNSYVEGDVDFIFGRGTMVLDGCTIQYLTTRQTTKGGYIVAPSTDRRNPFGILIINSTFTAETGTLAGTIHLGRAWDEGQADLATYATNIATASAATPAGGYPNGHVLIRESVLGPHVRSADPWNASTISRPFSIVDGTYPANRLYEFANTGAGSATP